uniref:Uncharacterized protein n=1 Tax=Chaetoceros debilis TaxID=122233 RepID=A0A7S3QD35_9STRA
MSSHKLFQLQESSVVRAKNRNDNNDPPKLFQLQESAVRAKNRNDNNNTIDKEFQDELDSVRTPPKNDISISSSTSNASTKIKSKRRLEQSIPRRGRAKYSSLFNSLEVQQLIEKNNRLEIKIAEKINSEEVLRGQLTRVMTELKKITESMDTMTRYCKGLESEKRVMKNQLVMSKNSKNSKVFFDNLQGRQDSSDDESRSSRDDKSLSEFSVAMVPTPRQTHRELLRQRTNVLESNKERLIEEDIELTVDTEMLYD